MPNFVLLDVLEKVSRTNTQYFQAIIIDNNYNVTKLLINEDKYNSLLSLKGKDITNYVTLIYKRSGLNSYYELYI